MILGEEGRGLLAGGSTRPTGLPILTFGLG